MTLIASIRAGRLAPTLAREAAVYNSGRSPEALQLERFNAAWAEGLRTSPWAREQRRRLDLPDQFSDWEEFAAAVPVQRKPDLKAVVEAVSPSGEDVDWRSTGGTTSEPMRFPIFRSESAVAQLDIWRARGQLGIGAGDRLFMIWGHAHLFKGAVSQARRRLSDLALGYVRWNAYDLDPESLWRAGDALLRSRARYVMGYSSALDRFARANAARASEFARLRLRAVIATAEGFPTADSRAAISDCLGCPTVMEYGAVETGPIAYEQAAGGFAAFWGHHRLEALPAEPSARGQEVVVTSLFTRALPLLRYSIGDLVDVDDDASAPLLRFAAVHGRCNEVVRLPHGRLVHSEAFTHAVRDLPAVRAFQVVCRPGVLPLIRYEADAALSDDGARLVRARLGKVDPALEAVELIRTARLAQTAAGKHQMIVEEG